MDLDVAAARLASGRCDALRHAAGAVADVLAGAVDLPRGLFLLDPLEPAWDVADHLHDLAGPDRPSWLRPVLVAHSADEPVEEHERYAAPRAGAATPGTTCARLARVAECGAGEALLLLAPHGLPDGWLAAVTLAGRRGAAVTGVVSASAPELGLCEAAVVLPPDGGDEQDGVLAAHAVVLALAGTRSRGSAPRRSGEPGATWPQRV